jgi:hypothetical protein
MGRKALVKVEAANAIVVKESCPYCYDSLPEPAKEARQDKPYRITSFDDICEGHQKCFLKSLPEKDHALAIDIINSMASILNPMAKLFLANIPYLVEEKKKRDIDWIRRDKEVKDYMEKMHKEVAERLAKEEAKRAELAAKGLLRTEESPPVVKERRVRKNKAVEDKPKKLSKAVEILKDSGLSPSELLERATGGVVNDANRVPETVQGDKPKNATGKKRRGRPPKRP